MEKLTRMAEGREADRVFWTIERDLENGFPLPPIGQRLGGPSPAVRAWEREEEKREKLRAYRRAYRERKKAEAAWTMGKPVVRFFIS